MLSQQTLEIVLPGGDEAEPKTPAMVVIDRAHGPSDALRADIAFMIGSRPDLAARGRAMSDQPRR